MPVPYSNILIWRFVIWFSSLRCFPDAGFWGCCEITHILSPSFIVQWIWLHGCYPGTICKLESASGSFPWRFPPCCSACAKGQNPGYHRLDPQSAACGSIKLSQCTQAEYFSSWTSRWCCRLAANTSRFHSWGFSWCGPCWVSLPPLHGHASGVDPDNPDALPFSFTFVRKGDKNSWRSEIWNYISSWNVCFGFRPDVSLRTRLQFCFDRRLRPYVLAAEPHELLSEIPSRFGYCGH